jgi:ribonucleotide reductase alpha subunit
MVRMSNLCVAGDTKITIKYAEPVYDEDEYIIDYIIHIAVIKMEELSDYIEDRNNIAEWNVKMGGTLEDVPQIQILSFNLETNENVFADVVAFAQTSPKAKVMRIEFRGPRCGPRNIVVTPDHKIYTTNRGYVMAKDLQQRDIVKFRGGLEVYCIGTLGNYSRVEYLEDEIPVYDITVEGTHNFFANDILVSNCMEIALLTEPIEHIDDTNGAIALCILSALNVGSLKSEKELEEHCDIIVRQLDELIDIQEYPVKAAELSARKYRPLGVGIIGLAHYLARNSVKYDDPEAVNIVHRLAESIQYYLLKASNQLAREKGPCEGFLETKYSDGILPIDTYKKSIDEFCSEPLHHDWESLRSDIIKYGLRNTTLTAAMPSESSSKLSNTTNGIDPPRGHLSVKRRSKIIVPQYTKLKNNYTLAWDMKSNEGYFNIVAVIQKFFDQSISANWYYNPEHYPENKVPMSVIVRDFLSAYQKGHKSAYYHITYDRNEENKELDDLINEILESGEADCESCKL